MMGKTRASTNQLTNLVQDQLLIFLVKDMPSNWFNMSLINPGALWNTLPTNTTKLV